MKFSFCKHNFLKGVKFEFVFIHMQFAQYSIPYRSNDIFVQYLNEHNVEINKQNQIEKREMIGSDVCTLKYKKSSEIMEEIDIKIGFFIFKSKEK